MRLADEQIQTELRVLRPEPRERFSAELDAWVAEGFPAAEPSPSGRRRSWRGIRLLPALAGAATVLLVVSAAVAISLQNYKNDSAETIGLDSAESPEVTRDSAETGAAGADIGPSPTTVPPVPPQDEKLRPGKKRVQERSASMTLSTEPGEVDDVADEVIEVVERYDGIVLSSNISVNDDKGRASFDLRVPTANLQATLADLSDLASVASRDEGTLDITSPFITAEERFQDAKASVDSILAQLAEADSSTEIESLRAQLVAARAELAAARSELGGLKQRADFSRLSLTVVGDGDADGWSIGDAADDAVSVLEDIAGAGLIALAVLIPLGGLALLAWLGITRFRRRQAERALDQ
jgi:hypothetical protein